MTDFASRFLPCDEWVLVRVKKSALRPTALAIVEKRNGSTVTKERGEKENVGTVIRVGPGGRAQATGALIPVDDRIVPGADVLFMGKTRQRPDDFAGEMEREGLWLVPASAVVCIVVQEQAPVIAR